MPLSSLLTQYHFEEMRRKEWKPTLRDKMSCDIRLGAITRTTKMQL